MPALGGGFFVLEQRLSKLVKERLYIQVSRIKKAFIVGVSARHVHLSREDMEVLFGKNYELTKMYDLLQPGEFAAGERVSVVGPKMRGINGVRILGPLRPQTQVELALSDAIPLGIEPPVSKSGSLTGSAMVTLVGPKGALNLKEGCIRANRHIHIDPDTAQMLGLADDSTAAVMACGKKTTLLGDVQVRVKKGWIPTIHLDTDDANAADVQQGDLVWLSDWLANKRE